MTRYSAVGILLLASAAVAAASSASACGAKAPPVGPEASIDGAPPLVWPVHGMLVWAICSNGSERRFHGIDIAVREGTPVQAAADGIVAYAGDELKNFGNVIMIRHDGDWVTVYAYVDRMSVKRDDQVGKGQQIALSGYNPTLNKPLLHFEIRNRASPIDPLRVLPER